MSEQNIVLDEYEVREVFAVFDDPDALERAAKALVEAGFRQADLSMIGAWKAITERLGNVYEPVEKMVDDPRVGGEAFVPKEDVRLLERMIVGVPIYVAGVLGALTVVATGGASALALAAATAGGAAVGAGLGAALARAFEQKRAEELARDIEAGGLILFVRVDNDEEERKALEILEASGGHNVRAHKVKRIWGTKDIPLAGFNPDPFIEPDPVP